MKAINQKATLRANREEIIDPLETIEGQTIAIINERRREEREKKAGEKIAKIAEETREERKARLQKAREEREGHIKVWHRRATKRAYRA